MRRTRFGFLDVFGFAVVVAGFKALRAGVRAAAVLLVLPSRGFWLWLGGIERIGGHREVEFPLKGCAYCPLVRGRPLGGGNALIIDVPLQVSVKDASGFAAHERFIGSSLGR